MIICPICKKKLNKENRTYRCENNHCFDLSKSGHINLLLDNQKHSKLPGDDKDMVKSRKNFLERDYYKGISDKLNEIVLKNCVKKLREDKDAKINILDIGCGEGYYTSNLKNYLDENDINTEIVGIDISKEAVISASKSHKGINWIVASATNIPIEDDSLDFIICMFAKIIPEEKLRTLKKGGKLIIVSTGENHLLQMKEIVYDKVRTDFYSPIEDLKIFNYVETINLKYETFIKENESIINLFNMTPYRWRSPREGIERLFSKNTLKTIVEVNFDIFEK